MFTFQSIMFVSLGFLCALLLGFVVAPAFWARAVRLTTERMRASLPLTEQEIGAERDRLRAENAIRVHQLTARLEQAQLDDARQKVEINRRDGTISMLERRLQSIETQREGSENARRVLEATITQRVPEIEGRLMEARQLLAKRDAEMTALKSETERTRRALEEGMQVNSQQRIESERMAMVLAGRGGRTPGSDQGMETEVALRAELENLRMRAREQATLIDQLQRDAKKQRAATKFGDVEPIPFKQLSGDDNQKRETPKRVGATVSSAEVDQLKNTIATQAAEIESLNAQLAAVQEVSSDKKRSLSLSDVKTLLKARMAARETTDAARDKAIEGLHQELATANERIARQAAYYQDELRRSAQSSAAQPSAAQPSATQSSAAQPNVGQLNPAQPDLGQPRSTRSNLSQSSPSKPASVKPRVDVEARKPTSAQAAPASKPNGDGQSSGGPSAAGVSLEKRLSVPENAAPSLEPEDDAELEEVQPQPRTKLMDRIADLSKR